MAENLTAEELADIVEAKRRQIIATGYAQWRYRRVRWRWRVVDWLRQGR